MIQPPAAVRGRVLLICSEFFSYHRIIAEQVRALGFEVIAWGDRASASTPYKLALRKASWLTGLVTARHFTAQIDALPPGEIDHILIVKGEGLSVPVISALRQRYPAARISLYLWDAVRNTRNSGRIAPLADHVASFDPQDAKANGWRYRPLFGTPRSADEAKETSFDWSFIGTIHSDRAQVIRRVLRAVPPGTRHYIFGFFPSPLLWRAHLLRDPSLSRDPIGRLSLTPLPGSEAHSIIAHSRAILDVEHPSQIGLTMRSIETLLSGRKLITTNRTVAESTLYDESRICVIDRANPVIDPAFFTAPFRPLPQEVIYAYSREGWARDVLGLPHPEPIGPY